MASHFKTPDSEGGRGDGRTRRAPSPRGGATPRPAGSSRPAGTFRSTGTPRLNTQRGGDESYHAPRSNRHAAATPRSASAHYIPVVSASGEGAKGRRDGRFVETDPYDLSGRRSGDPRKRAGRIVSTLLFVVGVALILAAAGMWIYNQWQYHEQDVINEELETYVELDDEGSEPPQVDWAGLKAVNDDVVGWVQIPGTVVNFPVYQGETNETYLRTSAKGTYSVGGQIFLDYENAAPGMVDAQSIIYGHHMRNGTMFKPISDMTNQEFFDGISTVWYVTENATYELEPLLVYQTDGSDTNARRFNFDSTEGLHAYLNDLLGKSKASRADAEDAISRTSNVLTLCTCNYDYGDDGRTLVVCVPKATDGE